MMTEKKFNSKCFVCKTEINSKSTERNKEILLPVCNSCKGSENEKRMVENYLDSLADDLVCGCI